MFSRCNLPDLSRGGGLNPQQVLDRDDCLWEVVGGAGGWGSAARVSWHCHANPSLVVARRAAPWRSLLINSTTRSSVVLARKSKETEERQAEGEHFRFPVDRRCLDLKDKREEEKWKLRRVRGSHPPWKFGAGRALGGPESAVRVVRPSLVPPRLQPAEQAEGVNG